jgi:signal transduction histidine kinase
MQRIGGRLTVESRPGRGTVVSASVPRVGAAAHPSDVTVS